MLHGDGTLALVNWGEARVGSALRYLADLLIHQSWDQDQQAGLQSAYDGVRGSGRSQEPELLNTLCALHRFEACVQSLT